MEIRLWRVNRRPCQPVRMRALVGTFVEISPPRNAWCGRDHLTVSFQQGYGKPVLNCPCNGFLDFRINNAWQRMCASYHVAFTLWDYNPVLPCSRMKMKKHGAATIHLKVEITLEHIRIRRKEKFDTTVLPNIPLMLCGYCSNVSVRDAKHHVYSRVAIGNFHLRLWEMIGFLPHVVCDQLGRNVFPWRRIPICITLRRTCLSCYPTGRTLYFLHVEPTRITCDAKKCRQNKSPLDP